MSFVLLAIDSTDKNYTVDHDLDGTLYRFKVNWNERGQFWTIGIYQPDDTPIVAGVKIVSNYSLFTRYPDPLLPPQNIYCIDSTGSGEEPGADNLGNDFIIVYGLPEDE
jgi:hypothetical protein